LERGQKYVLTLESDLLFLNENGAYSANAEEFKEWIGNMEDLGPVTFDGQSLDGESPNGCVLTVTRETGYYGVWNLKKPHIPGIKAGSHIGFVYDGESKEVPQSRYIGEKTAEGFGKIRIYKKDAIVNQDGRLALPDGGAPARGCSDVIKKELEKIDNLYKMRSRASDFAIREKRTINGLNASLIGRVALMLRQASDKADFDARVASVKSDKKSEIRRLTEGAIKAAASNHGQGEDGAPIQPDGCDGCWREILTPVFVLAKYWKKEARRNDV
jgi:hypothetical protein